MKETTTKTKTLWIDIKMDSGELGWGGMNWIDLTEDRNQWKALEDRLMNLDVFYI
jgi:hypothetical protein